VQIDKFVVDGFIKTSDLPGDTTKGAKPPRWGLDKKSGALVDASSGRSFNVGHMLSVAIVHVDLLKRQLDLSIANADSRSAGKSKLPSLNLGEGGGLGASDGAGFTQRTGGQRRAAKSKRRDKGKADHRADRKGKGKRQ